MALPGYVTPQHAGNMSVLGLAEAVPELPANIRAWTTTRQSGSFGLGSEEAVGEVMARWAALQEELAQLGISRLANAHQVLQIVGKPFVSIARLVTPKFVLDRHLPLVAFFLLLFLWVAMTILKIRTCLRVGVELCQ